MYKVIYYWLNYEFSNFVYDLMDSTEYSTFYQILLSNILDIYLNSS